VAGAPHWAAKKEGVRKFGGFLFYLCGDADRLLDRAVG